MTKSNSRMSKHTAATELNVSHGTPRIPSVAGKMFQLTSESAGRIG